MIHSVFTFFFVPFLAFGSGSNLKCNSAFVKRQSSKLISSEGVSVSFGESKKFSPEEVFHLEVIVEDAVKLIVLGEFEEALDRLTDSASLSKAGITIVVRPTPPIDFELEVWRELAYNFSAVSNYGVESRVIYLHKVHTESEQASEKNISYLSQINAITALEEVTHGLQNAYGRTLSGEFLTDDLPVELLVEIDMAALFRQWEIPTSDFFWRQYQRSSFFKEEKLSFYKRVKSWVFRK